ncbi:hypothetical protein Q5P01_010467 [Channa striata]|uniref:adenine phosphoribosyltransferase n=1 Tax=Channa striata TaxID=64152 RepID=A0AA88MXM9_CHASR|nr:hypothetical protein Q5P01_010467 [Channa striata]
MRKTVAVVAGAVAALFPAVLVLKADQSRRLSENRSRAQTPVVCQMDVLDFPAEKKKGWYLSLMAPNTKGPMFAWLDPSRLYCNSQAFADCVEDLLSPFQKDSIDLVAGVDAMGFILGASVATTLGKGFLAIRKEGHLCVPTEQQNYTDYTGKENTLELRKDVLKAGLRVIIVDQWIETGGTMKAAIQLVERQGATVAGVAAVAIENTEGGKWIKEHYRFSHCIPEELQSHIDAKDLDTFIQKFQQLNN